MLLTNVVRRRLVLLVVLAVVAVGARPGRPDAPPPLRTVADIPMPGHGIALDQAHRVGFVAGQGNGRLAVVDLATMRVLATHAVGQDPDVLAFDPTWGRLYVSAESGTVSVFTERVGGGGVTLHHDGDFYMPHAHTVAVDPRTHLVYFPLENIDGNALLRIMAGDAPTGVAR